LFLFCSLLVGVTETRRPGRRQTFFCGRTVESIEEAIPWPGRLARSPLLRLAGCPLLQFLLLLLLALLTRSSQRTYVSRRARGARTETRRIDKGLVESVCVVSWVLIHRVSVK